MEYFEYFIIFPEGDKQQIRHPLNIGDIVDINGFIYQAHSLNPNMIAYKVTGVSKRSHFKETTIYYKLDLMNRDEVEDEKGFRQFKSANAKYEEVFKKLEKKLKKKRRF